MQPMLHAMPAQQQLNSISTTNVRTLSTSLKLYMAVIYITWWVLLMLLLLHIELYSDRQAHCCCSCRPAKWFFAKEV